MNVTDELLPRKVSLFLKDRRINSEARIMVGFSGGPDSVTLLHLLKRLQPFFGYSLSALYVDHGIRSVSVMEKECLDVQKIASSMKTDLEIIHIPNGEITRLSKLNKRSIEDTAREFRYKAYYDIQKKKKWTHLALGHNQDDTVETIIMRVFQGSGIHGLKGIPESKGSVLRPLSSVDKKTILSYVENNDLKTVFDETNIEDIYLRNKVRQQLIPVIEQVFPGYKKALIQMSRKMALTDQYILSRTGDPGEFADTKGRLLISSDKFFKLSPYERMEFLYSSWDKWEKKPTLRLSFKNIYGILTGTRSKEHEILLSGHNYFLIQSKDRIFWKRDIVVSRKKSYLRVVTSGEYEIPSIGRVELFPGKPVSKRDTWLNTDLISGPLILRSKKPGDYIDLAEGRKTVKKLFCEWKIPVHERWMIPLIADRTGILLILGEPFGFKNRVTARHKKSGNEVTGKKLMFNAYMEY